MTQGQRSRPGPAKTTGPTIHDVARVAGVSPSTVSRAFARPRSVAAGTRARVAAAARQVGYAPSSVGKSQPNMILALVPHLQSSFFTPALDAAADILTEAGYCMTIGNLRGAAARERHYAEALRDGKFVGAILFTGSIPRDSDRGAVPPEGVPIVLACNEIAGRKDLSVFDVDDRNAATKMVTYLIGLGHRRIAHLRGPAGNVEAQERYQGYRSALKLAGIDFDPDLVWEGDFFVSGGVAAAGRYLGIEKRPTAVFAGNDQMAMGFATELKSAGFVIPHDVSVAGFDDVEFASLFDPPLTTMRQPREELGRLSALDLLRRLNEQGATEPRLVRMECDLIVRGSTQALRVSIERSTRPRRRVVAKT